MITYYRSGPVLNIGNAKMRIHRRLALLLCCQTTGRCCGAEQKVLKERQEQRAVLRKWNGMRGSLGELYKQHIGLSDLSKTSKLKNKFTSATLPGRAGTADGCRLPAFLACVSKRWRGWRGSHKGQLLEEMSFLLVLRTFRVGCSKKLEAEGQEACLFPSYLLSSPLLSLLTSSLCPVSSSVKWD